MNRNILIVEARFYDALADALVEGAVHVLEEAGCNMSRARRFGNTRRHRLCSPDR